MPAFVLGARRCPTISPAPMQLNIAGWLLPPSLTARPYHAFDRLQAALQALPLR